MFDEEDLFRVMGGMNNPALQDQIREHQPTIDEYCRRTGAEVTEISATYENSLFDENGLMKPEPMYFFTDSEYGGMTIEGVKESLDEL
jgi:hypothetical protein